MGAAGRNCLITSNNARKQNYYTIILQRAREVKGERFRELPRTVRNSTQRGSSPWLPSSAARVGATMEPVGFDECEVSWGQLAGNRIGEQRGRGGEWDTQKMQTGWVLSR